MDNVSKINSFVQGPHARVSHCATPERARPRALLLYPPIYDFALYDLFLKPYALCRLGAWLDRAGYAVRMVNAMDYTDPASMAALGASRREACGTGKFFRQIVASPQTLSGIRRRYARYGIVAESLERRIAAEQPDIVFVSAGMTYWYPGVVEAVRAVRGIFPGVPIVLGGIYPTLCPEHARAHVDADLVVRGPAFPSLQEFLKRARFPVAETQEGEQLLLMPEVNWKAGVVRLNRGCPLSCAYCSSKALEPRFVQGDAQLLFETVRRIHRRFATRCFAFYDDALLVNKEQAFLPFLERLLDSGLDLQFYVPNAVHLRYLDGRCAVLMRRSGFAEVRVGFESCVPEFHETLDTKLAASMLGEGLEHLLQAGFPPDALIAYVLAGLPGQEAGEVELSIHHAARFGIRVQVAEYSPTPGSSLWAQAVSRSPFALAEEPLTHNNSILPMRWRGFTVADMDRLKLLCRNLSERSVSQAGDRRG